jgi:parallel beta-helix repeat protein
MVIISLPVSPVSAANPPPITQSDTIINVQQGQKFLVRTTITFNNPAAGGVFALSIGWDGPARWDNYTIDNDNGFGAYAYWTSGGSGVGDPVENVDFVSGPTLSGWSAGASIDATNKNYYDGTFNVDFWLKAANQGAPHQVGLENNLTYGAAIFITEGGSPQLFIEDNIAVNTTAWTGGVIVSGTENAYTIDKNPPIEMVNYPIGSQPPIIAAQTVGGGKVIAANIAPSLRNGVNGWDDTGNAHRTLDQLLDTIIQWAKPGATQIAWNNAPGMFEYSAQLVPLNLTDNMIAKWGYNIYGDNRTIENINDNFGFTKYDNSTPIDVFVIPEYEPGSAAVGGNPDALSNTAVSDLANWVENDNGVLIVIECADYSAFNSYSRVNNKILAGLGMNWWFNNDSMYNDNDNYGGTDFHFYSNVNSTTAIGGTFSSASTGTGSNLIGMYSPSTLVPAPTLSSTLSVVPLENLTDDTGKTVTFNVTEHNTGSVADTFTMNLSQTLPWALSWPLVSTTNYYLVSEDAMVRLTDPTANFGSANTENLGSAVDNREVFLKFNLSTIPAQSISQAYLIMSFYPALTAANQMWADALQVSDDSWTEGTITWDNMPATGALIDTENLVRAPGPAGSPSGGSYYTTWDVTSYVQSQFGDGNDNVASICIRAADNTDNTSRQAVFDSKEYSTTTYRPYLVVTYMPTNYTTLVVDVPAGGSVTKTISVTSPVGILNGTQDNITITSTDLWDNTFTENAHCDVRASFIQPVQLYDENGNFVNYFKTIQSAINAAGQNGWTVVASPELYSENLYVNKENLTIESSGGAENTIIDAGGEVSTAINIVANGVEFNGFTVENAITGVELGGVENALIINNIITNMTGVGIEINESNQIAIGNDQVFNNGSGIAVLYSMNIAIYGCDVYNNNSFVFLPTIEIILLPNIGISALSSQNIVIFGSDVYNNNLLGIMLDETENVLIANNSIDNNGHGIHLSGADTSLIAIFFDNIRNNNSFDSGVHIDPEVDSTEVLVNYNNILGNTASGGNYGINNMGDGKLNARYNWWGSASGPGGVGTGTGDNISENVDYRPWIPGTFETMVLGFGADFINTGHNENLIQVLIKPDFLSLVNVLTESISFVENLGIGIENADLMLENLGSLIIPEGISVNLDSTNNGFLVASVLEDLGGAPIPAGLSAALLFDVSTIPTIPENVENVRITVQYTDQDVAGLNEGSLKLYSWDSSDNAWHQDNNLSVNTALNEVSGSLNHLTPFGVFGLPAPPAPPVSPSAAGVSISISPSSNSGTPGTKLVYTMNITNTGGATDTFDLSVQGGTEWSPELSSSRLTLDSGASGEVTLDVTVPTWAPTGLSTNITVTATSETDLAVSASTSCRAIVSAPTPGPITTAPTGMPWLVVLVIAGAIIAIILLIIIIFLEK